MTTIEFKIICGICQNEIYGRHDAKENILYVEVCKHCVKKYFGDGFNSGYEKGQEDEKELNAVINT